MPVRMSSRQKIELEASLREETEQLLGIIWLLSENESFDDLAFRAGLSKATLYRLWGGLYKRPQFLTIQKLCLAVGLKTSFDGHSIKISLQENLIEA